MKKFIIIGIVVFVILILSIFAGIMPGFGILDHGNVTQSFWRGDYKGNRDLELLQPFDRKGYICSYMENGESETITVTGVIHGVSFHSYIYRYKYVISLKENAFSNYEVVSAPGATQMYITNPNPGTKSYEGATDPTLLPSYSFTILGNKYANGAIKAELWVEYKENFWNPLEPVKWDVISSDEAELFMGWGGLYYPTGTDGRPRSTFEVGENVDMRVKTTYGGQKVGEGKTWRVVLYNPPDRGGNELEVEDYGDNVDTYFTFQVTQDMWSPTSTNEYRLEIFNTLVPKGYVPVYTIDILASAPSDVSFSATTQSKAGEEVSIIMYATTSSADVTIDHFRASVIYGTNDVLLPSDPLSSKWIIPPVDFRASNGQATIKFTPEKEHYVTIHAIAYDSNNRMSAHVKTWTMWIYQDGEVPDEVIEEEAGEDDYGGGRTDPWYPYDPSGRNWEQIEQQEIIIDWLGVTIAVFIILGFALIGFLVFKDPKMIIVCVIGGMVVAVLVYVLFFTTLLGSFIG